MSWTLVNGYSTQTLRNGCLMCGNSEVRGTPSGPEAILSTNFDIEWEGVPEFCATCIGEAAQMIGWFSGAAHAKEVKARKSAEALVGELQKQLDDKAAALRSVVGELHEATTAPKPKAKAVAK